MKRFILPLLLTCFVVLCTGCKKDETEVYNPDCKISKIWYNSNVGDADEVYSYKKNKKLEVIDQIKLKDSTYYTFEYTEGDALVSTVFHHGINYDESIAMVYINRVVTEMFYSINDDIKYHIVFSRIDWNNKRIGSIEETYDKDFFDDLELISKSSLFSNYFGNPQNYKAVVSFLDSKTLQVKCHKVLGYIGDNITSIIEEYPIENRKIARKITYDSSLNPFYGMPFAYRDLKGYSYNNPSQEKIDYYVNDQHTRTDYIDYRYQDNNGFSYLNDANYPRQFVTISSLNNIPINTYILYTKKK